MKYILIFFLSYSAWSFERSIYDLIFQPQSRQVLTSLGIANQRAVIKSQNSNDIPEAREEVSLTVIDFNLSYGLSKKLSINAELEYAISSSSNTNFLEGSSRAGSGQRVASKGISDPRFGVSYRFSDDKKWISELDLFYSPSLGIKSIGTYDLSGRTVEDGNFYRGNDLIRSTLKIGQKKDDKEWAILASLWLYGDGEQEQADGSQRQLQEASTDFSIHLQFQKKYTNKILVGFSAGAIFYDERILRNSNGALAQSLDWGTGYDFKLWFSEISNINHFGRAFLGFFSRDNNNLLPDEKSASLKEFRLGYEYLISF